MMKQRIIARVKHGEKKAAPKRSP